MSATQATHARAHPLQRLDDRQINCAPNAPGAYTIYRATRLVFIGAAEGARGLRQSLRDHWQRDFTGAQHSLWFRCWPCDAPAELCRLMLQNYGREHGDRLPDLNEALSEESRP